MSGDNNFSNDEYEMKKAGWVGRWSINYTPDNPDQLCIWKKKKPFFLHRVFNWYLLGNKWIDLK